MEPPSRQSPASLFCRQGRCTPDPKHLVSQGSGVLTTYIALRLTAPPRTTRLHSRRGCCWGGPENPEGQHSCREPLCKLRGESEARSNRCVTAAAGRVLVKRQRRLGGPGALGGPEAKPCVSLGPKHAALSST